MKFEGEHLLPGQLGHLFVIISFVAALLSLVSYFNAARQADTLEKNNWIRLGNASFWAQAMSTLAIFAVIFYICFHHYYEYMYAYKHASKELEYKYLLACIWEGQEGSFLLWTIWHAILGITLIAVHRSKKNEEQSVWHAPVMTVISLAQFFLLLMILGIYVFDVRIGNSPFSLTRDEIVGPIFSQPNYLSFIKDGMGLNVLLRNYWMVIHPPILFLGFASTIIPFAYAYAGFQTKRHTEWIQQALPWTLLSACVLGVGIMMGGKWAYESLSFGGYWAWDPVENASLVPWLMLIAGLHCMLIFKATQRSLRASYLFAILTFCFVLYSTFLTRTGILGDTSVHAFTEAGKAINIMIGLFVLSFAIPMLSLFFVHYKQIPTIATEEEMSSREFWMYLGALILFIAALFIIALTSIPVYSKTPLLKDLIIAIHKGPLAMPQDPEFVYNKVMIMVAILIGLTTAITQYLKYQSTPGPYFRKKMLLPLLITICLSSILFYVYPFTYYKHGTGFLGAIYVAFFCAFYAVIANALYIPLVLKNNFRNAGAAVSHVGFSLMIAGMLISSSNKIVISDSSVNGINVQTSKDPMSKQQDNPRENLTLIRDVPTTMGEYQVTYSKDSAGHEKGRKFYYLNFKKKGDSSNNQSTAFRLQPDVYLMKDNNMSSNPDTKSSLTKDVFTYISYAINQANNTDTAQFKITELAEGDSGFYNNGFFVLRKVEKNPVSAKYTLGANEIALMAEIGFVSKDSMRYTARPILKADSIGVISIDDTLYAQNLYVRFMGIGEGRKIKIGIKESNSLIDFVTVKAYVFPYINLVWLGLIVMALGILLSLAKRLQWNNAFTAAALILIAGALMYMFLLAN